MQGFRNAAGLIAAVILAGLGGLLVPGSPLVGGTLCLVGIAAAVWQGLRLKQNRTDPYDLKKLWDTDDEPETPVADDETDPDATAYCHRCGHAVTRNYARCPDCGSPL